MIISTLIALPLRADRPGEEADIERLLRIYRERATKEEMDLASSIRVSAEFWQGNLESITIKVMSQCDDAEDARSMLDTFIRDLPALGPEILYVLSREARFVQFDVNLDEGEGVPEASAHEALERRRRAIQTLTAEEADGFRLDPPPGPTPQAG